MAVARDNLTTQGAERGSALQRTPDPCRRHVLGDMFQEILTYPTRTRTMALIRLIRRWKA